MQQTLLAFSSAGRFAEICAFLSRHEKAIRAGNTKEIPKIPHINKLFDDPRIIDKGLYWGLDEPGENGWYGSWCRILKDGTLGKVTNGNYPKSASVGSGTHNHPDCCFGFWYFGKW